jgi:hypothetical protein
LRSRAYVLKEILGRAIGDRVRLWRFGMTRRNWREYWGFAIYVVAAALASAGWLWLIFWIVNQLI